MTQPQTLKHWLPAIIYALLSAVGVLLAWTGFLQSDWVFCYLSAGLCISGLGLVGMVLDALVGSLGLFMAISFGFMLYRVIRLGGARRVVNEADRLLLHRSILEIRQLCEQDQFGKALMLVESLRQKYPANKQLKELEARLHRSLDRQEGL